MSIQRNLLLVSSGCLAGVILIMAFNSPAFSAAGRSGTTQEEGDEAISIAQLPAAVAAAARPYFKDLSTCKASKETDEGQLEFEVEGAGAHGGTVSMKLTDGGAILEVERELEAASLPAAVSKALAEHYPGATISKAEALELHFYEIQLVRKGKKLEAKIAANGSIIDGKGKQKQKEGDDEDEEEEDEDHDG